MRISPLLSFALLAACTPDNNGPGPDPGPLDCGPIQIAASYEGLVRAPYQQDVRQDAITIAWGGAAGSTGLLRWFDLEQQVELTASSWTQPGSGDDLELLNVEISGLSPGATYCYEVEIDGAVMASGLSFRTAPSSASGSATFLALGDFGQGTTVQAEVAARMLDLAGESDLLLTTGDNAYGAGTYQQLQDFVFDYYRELFARVPVFPTLGNHDYITEDGAPYFANFFLPRNAWNVPEQEAYWSLDYGPLHIIGLDSERAIDRDGEDNMLAWAEADLAANDRPWTVALWHRPAFSGGEDGNTSARVEELLHPLMQAHGVALVLLGHEHFYERFHPLLDGEISTFEDGGVTYVITGGGGNFLSGVNEHPLDVARGEEFHFVRVDVSDCTLSFEAIRETGETFDSFVLQRC